MFPEVFDLDPRSKVLKKFALVLNRLNFLITYLFIVKSF